MSYLKAAMIENLQDSELDSKLTILKKGKNYNTVNTETKLTTPIDNSTYEELSEDSFRTFFLRDVEEECNTFIEESAFLDTPLIMKHYLGKGNFIHEIFHLFENHTTHLIQDLEQKSEKELSDEELDDPYFQEHDKWDCQ